MDSAFFPFCSFSLEHGKDYKRPGNSRCGKYRLAPEASSSCRPMQKKGGPAPHTWK